MTACDHGLVVMLPQVVDEVLHWWLIAGDAVAARGQDSDVVAASGWNGEDAGGPVMALVPVGLTAIAWREFTGLSAAQALGAARLEQAGCSIGADDSVHVVAAEACVDGDRVTAMTVTIGNHVLAGGLALLQRQGIEPDVVIPTALLVPPPDDGALVIRLGSEGWIRADRLAIPDEQPLTDILLGPRAVVAVDESAAEAALCRAFAAPSLNLRSGKFARRRRFRVAPVEVRLIVGLGMTLLLVTLAIALAYLARYHFTARAYDDRAAEALATADLPVDLVAGETRLDARLLAQPGTSRGVTGVAAALFTAVRAVPDARIARMSRNPDGSVTTALDGTNNAALMTIAAALQRAGYVVSAQPGSAGIELQVDVP